MSRVIAALIDYTLLFILVIILSFTSFISPNFYIYLALFIFGFYHLICEIVFDGQSLGKKLLKIKVVSLNGRIPTTKEYFLRWVFRMIDITGTSGIFAILFISSTDKNQRIGDLLAQTTVIKLNSSHSYHLSNLVNSKVLNNRKISFPKVIQYTDQDMLFIKEAISRIKKDNSIANQRIINSILEEMKKSMDIPTNVNKVTLLENMLIDYIALTR